MAKQSYAEKLKDPRWQKKRLEIMKRDDFKCRSCSDGEKMLHVHHLRYEKGLEPWEVKENDLITLCETCHEALHYIQKHPTLGIETFSCITRLYDNLEAESIREYLAEYNKLHSSLKTYDRF